LGEGDKSVAERKADGNITNIVKEAIRSGKVSTKINREMQLRHSQIGHQEGKSYLHATWSLRNSLLMS
jgi:hypothetical protein